MNTKIVGPWASHSATPIPKDLVPEVPIISTPETQHFLFSWTQHTGVRVLFGRSLFPDGGGRVGKMIYSGWMIIFPNLKLRAFWQDCPNPKQPAALSFETLRNWHPNCRAGLPNSCFHRKWRDLAAIFWIHMNLCQTRWLKRVILTTSSSCISFDIRTFYIMHLSEIAKRNSYSSTAHLWWKHA